MLFWWRESHTHTRTHKHTHTPSLPPSLHLPPSSSSPSSLLPRLLTLCLSFFARERHAPRAARRLCEDGKCRRPGVAAATAAALVSVGSAVRATATATATATPAPTAPLRPATTQLRWCARVGCHGVRCDGHPGDGSMHRLVRKMRARIAGSRGQATGCGGRTVGRDARETGAGAGCGIGRVPFSVVTRAHAAIDGCVRWGGGGGGGGTL